jgi:hypothetical protein
LLFDDADIYSADEFIIYDYLCWHLDALPPKYLEMLFRDIIPCAVGIRCQMQLTSRKNGKLFTRECCSGIFLWLIARILMNLEGGAVHDWMR